MTTILFLSGVALVNAGIYTIGYTQGMLSSGISLIVIAFIINYEMQIANGED